MNNLKIYFEHVLIKQNLFQKILNRSPKKNAIIEVNNLFFKNQENLSLIRQSQIRKIEIRYKTNLSNKFINERKKILSRYIFNYIIKEKKTLDKTQNKNYYLDKSNFTQMNFIGELLYLNINEINDVLKYHSKLRYSVETNYLYSLDKKIDKEVFTYLNELKTNLNIDDSYATKTINQILRHRVNCYFLKLNKNEIEWSEEIEQEFYKYESLTGENFSELHDVLLNVFKNAYYLNNNKLIEVEHSLNLKSTEKIYYNQQSSIYELKNTLKTIKYNKTSFNGSLAKGAIRFSHGSIDIDKKTEYDWIYLDKGRLHITENRIIFVGKHKNKSIRISNILSFIYFSNGVEIKTSNGNNIFYEITNGSKAFRKVINIIYTFSDKKSMNQNPNKDITTELKTSPTNDSFSKNLIEAPINSSQTSLIPKNTNEELKKIKKRVPRWKKNPNQINSQILNAYFKIKEEKGNVNFYDLEKECFQIKTFKQNYNQMKNFGKKNHGKVFDENNLNIELWKPSESFIRLIWLKKIM